MRRYDRTKALQFLAMIEVMTPLKVIPVGPNEQAGAIAILRRFPDQDLTLADAMGLYIMGVRSIRECWSTDFHLGLTGVRLVIHAH